MSPGWLLLIAGAGFGLGIFSAFKFPRLWLVSTLVGATATLAVAIWMLAVAIVWDWHATFTIGGQALHLRLDGISAFFLILLSVLGGAGTLYASEYWTDNKHPAAAPAGRAWWSGLLLDMGFVLLCANGLHFLIAWELFTICAYFLISLERQRPAARQAGWLFLAASHLAMLCLFAFFALLAARTGSWELGPLRNHPELAPLFWLALVGFGLKAGLFPLHIWLPSAHANAPSHVSAIMSGMAIKMGIYGLVRFTGWLPTPALAGPVIATLGVTSAVLGVAFALGQHDLKRLLAYHSVENIGIILIGLGFAMIATAHGHALWGQLALAGALLHVWNHGLFKSLLFLGSGSVLHATGTREMSRLGGLWRAMPWTTSLFALGATAIAGLPPLNGFVSEWLVYLGLFDAISARGTTALAAIAAVILLAMTGALALACFAKVCGVVFLGQARSEAAQHVHECGWRMRLPMLAIGAACVVIGLAPVLCWPVIAIAAAAWQPAWTAATSPAPLLTLGSIHLVLVVLAILAVVFVWRRVRHNGLARAGTWDCGYATPTARMQYTAGSFAGIITDWFNWILRPEKHEHLPEGALPDHATHTSHTPETVLEKIVEPAGQLVLRISAVARRLQHGRVQAYLLYLLIGIAALAAWVATMGNGK